jgi:hypothetical protein
LRFIPAAVLGRVRMKLSAGDVVEELVETANDGYDFVLIGGSLADTCGTNQICRTVTPRIGCPVVQVSQPDLLAFELMETLLLRLRVAERQDPLGACASWSPGPPSIGLSRRAAVSG